MRDAHARPLHADRCRGRFPPLAVAAAWIAAALLAFGLAARWTGGEPPATGAALAELAAGGSIVALWFASALGFGLFVRDRLRLGSPGDPMRSFLVAAVLGVAVALLLATTLGTLGLLLAGRGLGAWILAFAGALLLIRHVRDASARTGSFRNLRLGLAPLLTLAASGLAGGILLLAATSEPGFLWSSEFGGYDALSYHLQLPKEWIALGRIDSLPHNVYSAFPSFVEAAFLQLMVLSGGAERGAIACQLFAALCTLLAAAAVGSLAASACPGRGRTLGFAAGAAAYLGTPWTVVTGSLAYNDGTVALLLAGCFLLLGPWRRDRSWRTAAALGLLVGAACGAKLSAVGFVAAPVAALATYAFPRRRPMPARLATLAVLGLVAAATLAPWLVRNALAFGQPTFPFAAPLFGTGPWSAEQAAIFRAAHAPEAGLVEGLGRFARQFLAYGFGEPPTNAAGRPEPWKPLWSVLPWLGLAATVALVATRSRGARRLGVACLVTVLVQAAFWLALTHRQSRFLLPAAVPLAAAVGAMAGRVAGRREALGTGVAAGAAAWCLVPMWIYAGEGRLSVPMGGEVRAPSLMIGARDNLNGLATARTLDAAQDDRERGTALLRSPRSFWIDFWIPRIAEGAGPMLLVGDAMPFRYRAKVDYATVWDRGPLSRLAAEPASDPTRWAARLRADGYRFALVDLAMLERWRASGWLDPNLSAEAMGAFLGTVTPLHLFPDGAVLVDLSPPPVQPPAAG